MFFIKLMLIILLNETFAYVMQSDIETVILPAWKLTGKKKISLTLKAFGKQIELDLYRDDQTTSSAFKIWKHDTKDETELSQLNTSSFCYYHHNDHNSSAVINFCQEYGWEGFVLLENDAMEIKPVQDDFASLTLIDNFCARKETNISFGKIYRIKRSLQLFANSSFYNMNLNNFKQKRQAEDTPKKLTIELAVFFDEAAFRLFMPILNHDYNELRSMILAYVNNIEALFNHPSLGVPIDISLVYLKIMEKQPFQIPLSNEVRQLYSSFCQYASSRNSWFDTDQDHWDVALYLTGLDIYRLREEGRKDYSSTGGLWPNSVCDEKKIACGVVEFGPENTITSGFASSIIAVQKIAQILGIPNDNVSPCKTLDHIMATYRLHRGQLTWSECSRSAFQHLWDEKECLRDRTTPLNATYFEENHSQFEHLPGRIWTAKAQCEIFYHDKNANVASLADICQTLQCETSTQNNFTGPALEGTRCAYEKECQSGRCLLINKPRLTVDFYHEFQFYNSEKWSEWMADSCRSSCLKRSKGVVVKRRSCTDGIYQTAYCEEPYYDVNLCDDSLLCANKSRLTVSDYTKETCVDFSLLAFELKLSSLVPVLPEAGYQHFYIPWRPLIACVIFCSRDMYYLEPTEQFIYTAVSILDIATLNIDPYFPDRTWCHRQDGQDYYCRQHYCLPENYSFLEQ